MTLAAQPMTLEEYLTYDDGSDRRRELIAGERVTIPPENRINSKIALFLFVQETLWFNPGLQYYNSLLNKF
jgi:Uma2 family endonuclease